MEPVEPNIEQIEQKNKNIFCCKKCNYNTSRKLNYDRHILSRKHQKQPTEAKMEPNIEQNEQNEQKNNFECICGNTYKYSRGLSKHKKNCSLHQTDKIISNEQLTPELIFKVIEQNSELLNAINKLCDNNNNTNITNNNTQINNSNNNKTFNLNFFLNETCKDAMNIWEFVSSIKVNLEELENTGRQGYIEGISNIILKRLNNLEQDFRPIHCSDSKREVFYIKDNNEWQKENDNKPILKKAIKVIANENIKQISKWSEQNPDCKNSNSKKNDLYLKIVSNSMNGSTEEESCKNIDKIISNIAKKVIIDKSTVL
jgi:hypothetical protein